MAWPAYKTQLGKKFENNDAVMITLRDSLQQTADNSLIRDIPRENFVRFKIALEQLAANLQEVIDEGAVAVSYAQQQYSDGTLDVAAEYTAVRDAANSLATWLGGAIPDNTDLVTYDSASGGAVREVYTTAQLDGFRTRVAAFAATIAAEAP